jgi:hypothetical protein
VPRQLSVLTFLKTRIVGGPEFSDPQEDTLIFAIELDDVEISGPWLRVWGRINFTDTSFSADPAFYDTHNHITKPALDVHRRAREAEEAAQNGSQ